MDVTRSFSLQDRADSMEWQRVRVAGLVRSKGLPGRYAASKQQLPCHSLSTAIKSVRRTSGQPAR